MPTVDEISSQLRQLGGYEKWLGKREIQALTTILWEAEQVTGGVQGLYGSRMGLLVATDRRLIFLDKSMTGRLRVEDFPYDKITSIQYETGWIQGKICIYASGNRADITAITKAQVQPFAETIRARISGGSAPTTTTASAPEDLATKIDRLANLHRTGALSVEEFAAAKAKVLAE